MTIFFKNIILFLGFVVSFLIIPSLNTTAQTDTEFWFAAPELTEGHNGGGSPDGGVPAYLRFSTMGLPATVTISMPANKYDPVLNPTGFADFTFVMAANSTYSYDCSPLINVAGTDVNKLENKNLTANGILNFGVLIESTNPITAYYEVANMRNADIWALKGTNALGTEFYTPFQTHGANGAYTPTPYSSIDIVATEDNTVVTIIPTDDASYGTPYTTVTPGTPIVVNLNRGQTFSVFPKNKSTAVADRLKGTYITSTRPIAITLKDDSIAHTSSTCRDVAGDQIVPTDIIGVDYIVTRTFLNNHDHIYVVSTEPNTPIYVNGVLVTTLVTAGTQYYIQIPTTSSFYRISSRLNLVDPYKPIYVFHIGGFGCEQGGAIVPPIDICTGSTQVAWTRSNSQNFYLTMMVRDGAEDSFLFDGVVRNDLINPASFTLVPGTPWRVARFGTFTTAQIAVGQHLIENTEDIFHLGIVNGGSTTTCMYGYFSDFNELKIEAVVAGTNSSVLKTCYGNPVQLYAFGGTDYSWTPTESLDDPTAQMPWANPLVNTRYDVVVSGACDMTDTATIDVLVSTQLEAIFITDKVEGCAPMTVTFEDLSTGVAQWQYDFGDGSAYQKYDNNAGTPTIPSPPNPFAFTHTFQNNTALPIVDTITLLAKNADYCSDVYQKIITIYPSISASYSQVLAPTNCNEHTVTFTNTSTSNTADSYLWEFGDSYNKLSTNPTETFTHTFSNSHPHDTTYSMRMIATSPFECKDTATSSITVNPFFSADYTLASPSGCSPFTINVTNNSVGDTASYFWRLFDGVVTTTIRTNGADFSYTLPANTTAADKVYTLTLDLRNSTGCQKTVVKTITVYPQVAANFTVPAPGKYCAGSSVSLSSATSTGPITTWSWTFGDGGNSALQNPTYTFNNTTYSKVNRTIQLTVTSQRGCTDSESQNIEVYSYLNADFAVTPTNGCSPITATFTNNSRGSNSNTYLWNFGDATTSTLNTPAPHPYSNNGLVDSIRYKVKLTYTNEGSCIDTLSRYVTVYPYVTAGFTMAYDNALGCNPLTVTFTNTSRANAVYHSWDFGDDGTSGDQHPVHIFNNLTGADRTYTVTLTETTNKGCTATATANVTVMPFIDAALAIDTSYGCSPLDVYFDYTEYPGITSYQFDFDGNGTTDETRTNAQAASTNRTYNNQTGAVQNYNTRLTVFNHAGCSDFAVNPISIYPEITADFTPSNVADCNPLPVAFTNNSIFTGTVTFPTNTLFEWNFGDGGSSTDTNPNHTFNNNNTSADATYIVQLTATTEYGCSDTYSENIQVWSRLESGFTFDQSSNCSPFNVTFYPSAVGATVYNWDYDGAIPNESFPNGNTFTRAFSNADPNNLATYTITLEVENAHGCSSTSYRDLDVYPLVVADFSVNPLSAEGCSDLTVTFGNSSTGGSLLYEWDFDDGESYTTLNQTNFDHIFVNRDAVDKIFNVELSAINPNGCISQIAIPITVHPKVEANFTFVQDSTCTPFRIEITNSSLNGTNFDWDFGHTIGGINRDTSTVKATTSFLYTIDNEDPENIQTYTISLHAETVHGAYTCQDDLTRTITVHPRIVVNMVPNSPIACSDHTVIFDNQSTGGVLNFNWDFDDGETATSANRDDVTHTFINRSPANEINSVLVTATNVNGCFDSQRHNITTYPKVEADFRFESDSVCTPFNVTLINNSLNGNEFQWDFGYGGLTSTVFNKNPIIQVFDNAFPENVNYYNIELISLDNITGCADTISRSIEVFPRVIANFVPDNPTACSDHTVVFDNLSTGGTLNFNWIFGDGESATSTNRDDVTHIFTNRGTIDSVRSVLVTAVNSNGCFHSQRYDITTHPKVESDFRFTMDSLCTPFLARFENGSLNGNEFRWDFGHLGRGDTVFNKNVFTQEFDNLLPNTIQTYTIKLISLDNVTGCIDSLERTIEVYPRVVTNIVPDSPIACSDHTVVFSNNSTGGANAPGAALSFFWDYGDGETTTTTGLTSPTHTFVNRTTANITNSVLVTATNPNGCFHSQRYDITTYPKVEADFRFTMDSLCTPFFARFENGGLNGNEFQWDFGHMGRTLTTFNKNVFTQEFDNASANTIQTYTIQLTSLDNVTGCQDVTTRTIEVYPRVITTVVPDNPTACSDHTVVFTNNSTGGANAPGAGLSFFWDYGDGETATTSGLTNPTHTFINRTAATIINSVLVTATNPNGCFNSQRYNITTYPKVEADFRFTMDSLCTPFFVRFENGGLNGNEFQWDFGHMGRTLTTFNKNVFTQEFDNASANTIQTYTIQLTSLDNITGCQDVITQTIDVYPRVVTDFTPDSPFGCSDHNVLFTNNSTGGANSPGVGLTFFWTFSDGETATSTGTNNLNHLFINRTSSDVTNSVLVTGINPNGCFNSKRYDITTHPKVESQFTLLQDSTCSPFRIELTNSSLNGTNFYWDFDHTIGGINRDTITNKATSTFQYTIDSESPDNIQTYSISMRAETVHASGNTCQNTSTKELVVHPRVITNMIPDVPIGCSEHRVIFDNQSTGGILTFNWIFGDGQSATSINRNDVTHIFINRGVIDSVRSVLVTATNVNGCFNSKRYDITTHPKVEAGFTFANQSLCTPFYLDFTNSGLNGNKFFWDFGYSSLDTITRNKNTFAYLFDNPTLNDVLTYSIQLISLDSITGCTDTIDHPVTVFPRVVSRFDADNVIGCNPLPVEFTNQSSGLATYLWEFGDGTISIDDSPSITYTHPNKNNFVDYTVSLTATNVNGCKSFKDTVIRVNPLVQAMFQVNQINGCTPLTINMSNSSTSPQYAYSWDWGDGRTDNTEQPLSITYTNSTQGPPVIQNRIMRLITSYVNDNTCTDTIEIPIAVYPHIYPDFNVDTEGCHPHNVAFTNLTDSYNPTTTSYAWDLGNSVNSYIENPSLTYSNQSKFVDETFSVKLTATSEHGCVDSIRRSITVHPRPVASMGVVGDYIACSPFNVQLDNLSLGTNLTYTYTFGDGQADLVTNSDADVFHVFSNLNNTTEPFQIDLHIESEFGCDDIVSQTIYVYPEVTTQFAFNPGDAACNPFEVTMVNNTQNGYLYEWDFDDGITSNLKNPLHRFINLTENDKTFNVHLRSISEFECFDEDEHLVTVYPQPVAAFSIDPPLKIYPDATFNYTNMTSPAADSWDYHWDYGDSWNENIKNPVSHTYLAWGPKDNNYQYNVTLRVTNANCADTITNILTLLPAKPISKFSANIYEACSPLVVNFINESLYSGPNNGGTYFWDFDDGQTSTQEEPIHTFTEPGYYNVKLTVTGDGGDAFYYLPFRVFQNPEADFAVFPSRVMLPDATVHLYNLTKYGSRYKWEFIGDNFYDFSLAKDTVYTFRSIGEFRISLTAYAPDSLGGCSDFTSKFPAVWVEGIGKIEFPDAFVPNRNGSNGGVYDDIDYKNEVFHPVHYGVTEYKLMVFNRWGEQIFQSRDINIGWDGYFDGKLCEQGVYIWRAIGKYTNGKIFDMKGNVTLLR